MSTLKYGTQDLNPVVNINPIDDSTASDTSVYSSNKTQGLVDNVEDEVARNLLDYDLSSLKALNTNGTWSNNVYTLNGTTFTVNSDMSVTVNGTATDSKTLLLLCDGMSLDSTNIIIHSGITTDGTHARLNYNGILTDGTAKGGYVNSNHVTFTNMQSITNIRILLSTDCTAENMIFYPMLEYGTVSHSYKQYDDSFATHEEVRVNRFDTLQNEGIAYPTINGITNYEDASGVYHKNLACVDLGTLDWVYSSSWGTSGGVFTSATAISDMNTPTSDTALNGLCAGYTVVSRDYNYYNATTKQLSIATNSKIGIRDFSYTDADTFKSAMSGVLLFYELATPQTWNSKSALSEISENLTGIITNKGTYSCEKTTTTNISVSLGSAGVYLVCLSVQGTCSTDSMGFIQVSLGDKNVSSYAEAALNPSASLTSLVSTSNGTITFTVYTGVACSNKEYVIKAIKLG